MKRVLKGTAARVDRGRGLEPSKAARCGQGASVLRLLRLIAMDSRNATARHGLSRLLGYGRDLMLAAWAIVVLAFCVLGLAGAMR